MPRSPSALRSPRWPSSCASAPTSAASSDRADAMAWVMVLMPVAFLVLGFPLFVVLIATSAIVLVFFAGVPSTVIHQVMFASIDKYALLAVPFFIFAGELMGRGGVSVRLMRWVTSFVGGVRG